jgi:hypothetical protein
MISLSTKVSGEPGPAELPVDLPAREYDVTAESVEADAQRTMPRRVQRSD